MTAIDVTSPGERVTLGCFVDRSLKRALLERARQNERTLSGELRVAIIQHLNTEGHTMTDEHTPESTDVPALGGPGPDEPYFVSSPTPTVAAEVALREAERYPDPHHVPPAREHQEIKDQVESELHG